ncbi:glycosyltransferase [Clostridium sp. NSJ-49]|uniref:glycosyltransferase n=2 Tax=Clostridium TaxID=1485 RepID=UPI00164C6C1D|nr:glycosyltransferase [Clostridium sp. NSJ-49]MBC5624028.1 glycosyltransferase [Clostridium sp. NSJ-49]
MTKVIFITNKLITGGVEKALLEMIKQIPKDNFEITIGVFNLGGELEKSLRSDVKIIEIPEVNESIKTILIKDLAEMKLIELIKKIKNLIMCNLVKDYNEKCRYRCKLYRKLNEIYDVAVCYHKPTDLPVPYVIDNVKSNKKVLWIHMDMSKIAENEKRGYYKLYKEYDEIICISKAVKNQVINIFPEFKNKTKVIYNFIDKGEIRKLSDCGEKFETSDGNYNILTVARLSTEKGHDLIIEAAILLKKKGVNFRWYLIGEGPIKNKLLKKVEENDLKKYVILLGNKDNPYGYFKTCDIYVQPSLEEGFGITVSEAKIFEKPIIITKFATSTEHIIDRKTGYIVDFNGNDIACKIEKLIKNSFFID